MPHADPEVRRLFKQRNNRERQARAASALATLKLEAGCADCGYAEYPEVLEFDHVRGVKLFNIGEQKKRALDLVLDEVEKCDVVCANCHRVRTTGRSPWA